MAFREWWKGNGRSVARFACYWATGFFLAVVHWLHSSFGPTTLPQLIYYLHFSSGLLSETDSAFLGTFCLECLLGPTLIATLLIAIELYVDTSRVTHAVMPSRFGPMSSFGRWAAFARRAFPYGLLVIGFGLLSWTLSVVAYVASMFGVDQFAKNYVEPSTIELRVGKPKNLVLVYVESLEASYSDKEYFGEDLLSALNAVEGSSFESFLPSPGSSWTMAGIVSSQCGIPLQLVFNVSHSMDYQFVDSFLPRATCLGDILGRAGYRNVFVGGADLEFASKGKFLESHGYQEMYGWREWQKSGGVRRSNGWGLSDDDLLQIAKTKLLELSRSDEPFNLTILTVDTHQPDGHYSKFCLEQGAAKFEDIVKCTSKQLADFIDFAMKHDLMKRTNFVIVGDHLAQANPVSGKLESDKRRRIFNKFISMDPPKLNREVITHFDLLPTVLEFLGIDVVGNRLALGCSAFYETPPRCPELAFSDRFFGNLSVSPVYRALWTDR